MTSASGLAKPLSHAEAKDLALREARRHAASLRQLHEEAKAIRAQRILHGSVPPEKPRLPTVAASCIDTRTGRAYHGHSAEQIVTPPELAARLPNPSTERWSAENCGEAKAASRAIADGAKFDDLVTRAVTTRTGDFREPCGNCAQWVR